MLIEQSYPLADAVPLSLRIKFYVDGYPSYLFADEAAGVSRYLLEEGLRTFPERYASLFDFELSPEKKARLVANCLHQVAQVLVSREEAVRRAAGVDIIDQHTATGLLSGLSRQTPLFDAEKPKVFAGRSYFQIKTEGIVFCPRFEAKKVKAEINKLLREYSQRRPEDRHKHVIRNLENHRNLLDTGYYDQSQRYYTALGRELGEASRKGFLRASLDNKEKIIGEKAVDGDMQTRITADAYSNAADVFVLMTNDGDHYPAAKEAQNLGKTVVVVRHSGTAANALRASLGDENVIQFYGHNRDAYHDYQFCFDEIWLRDQNEESVEILEDMRMQYAFWETNGQVERPSFPNLAPPRF
ncbi:MAG: NYN domain-containing protein [Allopontixanthobacter sediminis]